MVAINRPYTAFDFGSLDDVTFREETLQLSVARIDDAKLAWARGFGPAVHPDTPFPVGGMSKLVTALTVLRLAADNRLGLDTDVNTLLKHWQLPVNDYTLDHPVTLRQLLSHQSGIVDPPGSFSPLHPDEPIPALIDVLAGETHFHRGKVAVTSQPLRAFSYSDAGYCVVQQVVQEVTGLPFVDVATREVFEPLGLLNSFYPVDDAQGAFPAAGGLWTSAVDLAELVMSVGHSLEGDPDGILPLTWAQEMLLPRGGTDWAGLGVFVSLPGLPMSYSSQGHGSGFQAMLVGAPHLGQGVVVLARGDFGSLPREIIRQVAQAYHWPDSNQF